MVYKQLMVTHATAVAFFHLLVLNILLQLRRPPFLCFYFSFLLPFFFSSPYPLRGKKKREESSFILSQEPIERGNHVLSPIVLELRLDKLHKDFILASQLRRL